MSANTRTLQIEIEVDDKGARVIRQVGSESEKAGKKGRKAFSGMDRTLGGMNKRLAAAAGKVAALAAAAISIGALIMAFRKLKAAVESYVGLADQQEKVEGRLAAVVRSTGGAAGYSAGELYEMAAAMQELTTIGDEVTIGGMAILATFKQIRGEAFERATQAALDMADVMEGDLKGSIVMIGKALNDPIANLSAMSRAGVQFNDTQKETIKRLWEMGDAAGAQAIILDELESQFGGAAEAARKRFGGAVTAAKNALGDMREEMGFVITKNQFFIDMAHMAEEQFKKWGEYIRENREDLMHLAKDGVLYFVDTIILATKTLSVFHKVFASVMKIAIKAQEWSPFGRAQSLLKWAGVIKETRADKMRTLLDPVFSSTKLYDEMIPALERMRDILKDIQVRPAEEPGGSAFPGLPTEEDAAKAEAAARDAALAVAQTDKEALEARLGEYKDFYGELQRMIAETAEREKRHIQELNALYKQKADIQMSTEAMIRGLREARMSPAERYESQREGLGRQYMAALKLSGQEQVKALEAYKQAVQSLASQYSGGIMAEQQSIYGMGGDRYAVSSREIIETAISDIQRAASVQQRALAELSAEKERQIEADRVWKNELVRSANDVAGEIEMLEGIIDELSARISEMDRLIKIEGEDRVTPVVNQIQTALNSLHDKTVTITTIHQSVYAGAPAGGESGPAPEGSFASGTRWVPKTGLYVLHQGEEVRTPSEVKRERSGGITVKGDINVIIPETAAPQSPDDYRMITRTYIIPELQRAGRM